VRGCAQVHVGVKSDFKSTIEGVRRSFISAAFGVRLSRVHRVFDLENGMCQGAFSLIRNSPMQVSDDADGVHKCDHTRGVDTKQLDDGIDHTFVSACGSETICPSFLFKLCPP